MQESKSQDDHSPSGSADRSPGWLITGANGNLGRRLMAELLAHSDDHITAVVRSEGARQSIEQALGESDRLVIRVLDYTDVAALSDAAQACEKAVHLVGILKESRSARYEDAHERSTAALLQALARSPVSHLTYLSIIGSDSAAANACLASKGRAEDLCRDSALLSCVLRVPMVLGEGDYAGFALNARAHKNRSFTFRAESLEQPIYAGDVVRAIVAAGRREVNATLDLGGPEIMSRRALTERAARVLGRRTRVISLPLWLGLAVAGLLDLLSSHPPVTRAMLEVLDHDDNVQSEAVLEALGMTSLTSLDDMLTAVLIPQTGEP